MDDLKIIFRDHIKGMIYGYALGSLDNDQNIIVLIDAIIESNCNFYDDDLSFLIKKIPSLNMEMPILSILNIYRFLREPHIIHHDFYKFIRDIYSTKHYETSHIISCWILCHFIRNIFYAMINKDKKIILNLKQNTYKTYLFLLNIIPTEYRPNNDELIKIFNTHFENCQQNNSYKCLRSAIWVLDIIYKYEELIKNSNNLQSFPNLNFKKIITNISYHIDPSSAGALLGSYLGYEKLPLKLITNKDKLEFKINELFKKMKLL